MIASYLAESFDDITFSHVSRDRNTVADELAQLVSGAQLLGGEVGRMIPILHQLYPALVNQQVLHRDQVIRTQHDVITIIVGTRRIGRRLCGRDITRQLEKTTYAIPRQPERQAWSKDKGTCHELCHLSGWAISKRRGRPIAIMPRTTGGRPSSGRGARRDMRSPLIRPKDAMAGTPPWVFLAEYAKGLHRVRPMMCTVSNPRPHTKSTSRDITFSH